MDRKKAHEHLQRVAGLTVQAPKQAQHPANAFRWNDGPGTLAVSGGLWSPYRISSRFGPKHGQWLMQHIYFTMRVADACRDAALNHPLYISGASNWYDIEIDKIVTHPITGDKHTILNPELGKKV